MSREDDDARALRLALMATLAGARSATVAMEAQATAREAAAIFSTLMTERHSRHVVQVWRDQSEEHLVPLVRDLVVYRNLLVHHGRSDHDHIDFLVRDRIRGACAPLYEPAWTWSTGLAERPTEAGTALEDEEAEANAADAAMWRVAASAWRDTAEVGARVEDAVARARKVLEE